MGQGEKLRAMKQGTQSMAPLAKSLQPNSQMQSMTAQFMAPGIQGLDVSGWQASVNWATQYNLGARFAYVKATEGINFTSSAFSSQYSGAAAAGLIRGAYHFALPSQSSAVSQADFFVNNGGGWSADGKTMPPLLDIEYNPYSNLGNTCYNMSASTMVAWIRDFSNQVQFRTGRLPMIYTTTDWWTRCTGNSGAFSNQALHIAAYSTVVGTLPKSWSDYSVWQYSSSGPFAGDSNAWNGTLDRLKVFATTADAPRPVPSIPSSADVVAADSAGVLWDYPAPGDGTLGTPRKIGVGWSGLRSINVIDWNADGVLDIIAQWTNGSVTVYPGLPAGGFAPPQAIASGWQNNQLTIGYWLSASNYPQILSRNPDGALTLWMNTTGGALQGSTSIGNGWGSLNLTMVDFDGDGNQDVLAQNPAGALTLYRSDGSGRFISESRPQVGSGWNTMTSITIASGYRYTSDVGLMARNSAGALIYYPVPGNSTFGAPSNVGTGWNPMLIAGGENVNMSVSTPPTTVAPSPPTPSIKSTSDVVSIDSGGRLWRYPVANAKLGTGAQIGTGFTGVKSIHVADWNSDGVLDLIVQWSNGRLSLYPGVSTGSFNTAVTLADTGWGGYDMTVGQWITGSSFPAIVAQSPDGTLTSFTTTNGTSLTAGTVLAHGMTRMHPVMTDFDGDGNADIAAVNNIGQLVLYRSNGKGSLIPEQRPVIGNGWQGFTSVGPAPAFTSSASKGVLARTAAGVLVSYPTAGSTFGTPSTLATDWNGNTIAGSSFLAPQQAVPSLADVVAVDASGTLWNYAATGSTALAAPYPIATGWMGIKSLHVVDWNSDGLPDILAQSSNGAMTLFPGTKAGALGSAIPLTTYGWGSIKFIAGNWVKGAKYPGLVGTNGQGDLYYWPNPSGRTMGAAQRIGIGWGSLTIAMQDFDSDGNSDLLAVDTAGIMRLYRSNGSGGFIPETRTVIGTGWSSFSQIAGINGFAGVGTKGILTFVASGQARYYPVDSNSTWGSPAPVSQGVVASSVSY